MGCLRSLGCLVVLAVVGAGGWVTRAMWLPRVEQRLGLTPAPVPAPAVPATPAPATPVATAPAPPATPAIRAADSTAHGRTAGAGTRSATGGATSGAPRWEAVSDTATAHARDIVDRLARRDGPVFANLTAAELTGYVIQALSRQLPPTATGVQSAVVDDRLEVRATVRLSDIGGAALLGPLAMMIGDDAPVQFGGTLGVVRPGLAQYRVTDVQVKGLDIPSPMIPDVLHRLSPAPRPQGVATDGLALVVPNFIADVRVHDGKITLYKNVP